MFSALFRGFFWLVGVVLAIGLFGVLMLVGMTS